MLNAVTVGFVVLAVLAVIVIAVTFRRRDVREAIGQLSRDTRRSDRSGADGSAYRQRSAGASGRAVELAARAGHPVEAIRPSSASPPPFVPPDPETLGVSRRQFLDRGIVAMFALGISGFGSAVLAFLWPREAAGFGATIKLGRTDDIRAAILTGGGFLYVPEGRLWVTQYPTSALQRAEAQYSSFSQLEPGLRNGLVALYQTCPHLGCRVPECLTSQWFECPCHGSQYNRVGEYKAGPAPRGMDRFPMTVNAASELLVDTGTIILGPPVGTNTTGQEAEGAHCLGGAGEH